MKFNPVIEVESFIGTKKKRKKKRESQLSCEPSVEVVNGFLNVRRVVFYLKVWITSCGNFEVIGGKDLNC